MKTLKISLQNTFFLITLMLFFLASAIIRPAYAAAGDLDTSFDGDGKVTTAISPGNLNEALALTTQADGKIIAAGRADFDNTGLDFAIARYLSDGSLDPSFGNGGSVTTDFLFDRDEVYAVTVQSNGNIVVAGLTTVPGAGILPALARYLPTGALDTSFGSGGLVTISGLSNPSVNLVNAVATAVLIQTDGRIVVAGYVNQDFLVARLNSNGSMDTDFGSSSNGIVITDIDGKVDYGFSAALQTDGKIVVAGQALVDDTGVLQSVFAIARYNPDGSLDTSFGAGGLVKTTEFTGTEARGVAITSDGKIIAAGTASNAGDADFGVARYLTNGQLDDSFAGAGYVSTDLGTTVDFGLSLSLQADDKPVVVGSTGTNPTGAPVTLDFAVVRYNADGSLDTNFSDDGIVITDIGVESGDFALASAIQADGKILAAGWSFPDRNNSFDRLFAIARYLGVGDVVASIEFLIQDVENLVAAGELNQGQGNALLTHLQRAIMHLDAERIAQAVDQLTAFIQIVEGFRQGNILTESDAQTLVSQAESIINELPKP